MATKQTKNKKRKKLSWESGDYMVVDKNIIHILDDLKITNGKEIMLFCKIISLAYDFDKEKFKKDGCVAGNDYFSKFLCVTERNIKKYLHDLKEKELIKTFEEKQGMKTTVRHIYPQIEKLIIPEEQMDTSSDEGGEHLGTIRGTYESEEGNIQVISGEYMDTHIIEDKRNIKEDNIGLADARTDASLICADAHLLESQIGFQSEYFSDSKIKEIMILAYKRIIQDSFMSSNDIFHKLVESFTRHPYKCKNINAVSEFANYIILHQSNSI